MLIFSHNIIQPESIKLASGSVCEKRVQSNEGDTFEVKLRKWGQERKLEALKSVSFMTYAHFVILALKLESVRLVKGGCHLKNFRIM